MQLLDLHIDGFGKFHDYSISFEDDLNIIYGKNEAGKSTLHTFIRCMFFGLERGRGRASRNDLYSRYEPWKNKGAYGGQLRVEKDGIVYRIERNFYKGQKPLIVINETEGKEISPGQPFMDSLLGGLTETSYNNTISIGQLRSVTDGGMVSELRNYIANMNTSGSMALNITKATSYLKNRQKEFERQLIPEAARNYTALLGKIREIEKEIATPEYENSLSTYENMRSQVKTLIREKQEAKETLLQKIGKGHQTLATAQFSNEEEVIAYQRDAQNTYSQYCQAERSMHKRFPAFLTGGFLFLGLACFLLFAVSFYGKTGNTPTTALVYAGIGALLIVLAIGLYFLQRSAKKEFSMVSKILQEILSRHLGDGTISPEAMVALDNRMKEYGRLSHALVESEKAVEELAAEIASLQEKESNCEDVISKQQRMQWELEKKLEQLTNCKDQVEALKQILSENERVREEILAIDLAIDTMTELSASIRESFGLYLNKAASDMIAGITDGIYDSMSVDENLDIFMNTKEKLVPVSQVSSGTMDQIYLALRLASAKLIQPDDDIFPLIFDDSFVLYDDQRLRTTLKWLSESCQGQLIIFTCHQREAQMLTANQMAYHLITV